MDGVKHWAQVAADAVHAHRTIGSMPIAPAIAEDVRMTMRSVMGIAFRLDGATGVLHASGVDGTALPAVKRD